MNEQVPTWKFWHPVPFGVVLGVLLLGQIACNLLAAMLSMALGMSMGPLGAGLGALLAWVVVLALRPRYATATSR